MQCYLLGEEPSTAYGIGSAAWVMGHGLMDKRATGGFWVGLGICAGNSMSLATCCYAMALLEEEMNLVRVEAGSCTQAILVNNSKMGIEAADTSNGRTVAGWNILLRVNRESFPLPKPNITNKQH